MYLIWRCTNSHVVTAEIVCSVNVGFVPVDIIDSRLDSRLYIELTYSDGVEMLGWEEAETR